MEQKLRRNTTLGDNLRRLRKAAGLTQAMAVAQLQLLGFDISREILSQTENGRYNVPVSLLKALKQIYKVPSYDDFFQRHLNPSSPAITANFTEGFLYETKTR